MRDAIFHRAPLAKSVAARLPIGAIRPRGWLQQQLQRCAEGITGQLFDIWPDVGENSGWLGGDGESWERGPYYLDGLLPLAYILRDEKLIARANRFVEWVLENQREDGFIGPAANDDWWPRMVMCKVLMQAYSAKADRRILQCMLRYYQYQYKNLPQRPLRDWGRARAADAALTVLWLYNITGREFLLKLARLLLQQGLDWTRLMHNYPYTRDQKEAMPWSELKAGMESEDPERRAYYSNYCHSIHVVDHAMGLKYPALSYALDGGLKQAQAFSVGYPRMMKAHGVAHGLFTGDELLSGASPSQGTETCAVVEAMYSLEVMMQILPDATLGDLLEKLAFNPLPAANTRDYMGHQYCQQVNQIRADVHPRTWYNTGPSSNLFGLEPNFGCCTANLHQGWPKYAASLWMALPEGGFVAQSYAPCHVQYHGVAIEVSGNYPYDEEITIQVRTKEAQSFPMQLRIPAWAEGATVSVNGEPAEHAAAGTFHEINRLWQSGDTVTLHLPMAIRVEKWYHQSLSVERGPLLFALQVGEKWEKLGGHEKCPDWEVSATTPWNYALLPEMKFEVCHSEDPFLSGKPMLLKGKGVRVPSWKEKDGSAAPPPVLPLVDTKQAEEITLAPYGMTYMRIGQFPQGRAMEEK